MKALLFLITTLSSTLLASNPEALVKKEPKEAYDLFQKAYVENEDNQDLFYLLAANLLEQQNSTMSVSHVVDKLQKMLTQDSIQKKYVDNCTVAFTTEQMRKMNELLQCPLYQQYRKPLEMFMQTSHAQTMQLVAEIIANKDETMVVQKSVEITALHKDNADAFIKSAHFVVIDVYADWCAPCKYMLPIMQDLADQYAGKYAFGKLNAEHEEKIAKDWQIAGFPTILFFKDGKIIGRHVGFTSKTKLEKTMNSYFGK